MSAKSADEIVRDTLGNLQLEIIRLRVALEVAQEQLAAQPAPAKEKEQP